MNKIKTLTLLACVLLCLTTHRSFTQWVSINSGVNSQLLSVYFTNQFTGFACGLNGKVLKTTNSGTNWQVNTVVDTTATFTSLHFINSTTGYLAGRILITGPVLIAEPIVLKTTNTGTTWVNLLSDSGYTLWPIHFINENTGFAGGGLFSFGPNKFLSTSNGGVNWQISSFAEPGYIGSVSFYDMNTGLFINHVGYVYKTVNSGQNWNLVTQIPNTMMAITYVNSSVAFSAGGNIPDSSGKIFRTTSSGTNWDLVYSDNHGLLSSIVFSGSSTGFAVGQREYTYGPIASRIIKTTNAGNSWFIDTLFSSIGGLASVFFTNEVTGYVVGSSGAIFKTTTGGNPIGIKPITGNVPAEFSISQNYPNPFNPVTKIKFDIPPLSFGEGPGVRLIVYDVLGRQIAVLVNEQLQPGTYEVEWDGSNYSSGIYYYSLITTEFVETKKMVLIK